MRFDTKVGIVFKLSIHEDAEADLELIEAKDPDAAANLIALLEEFEGDQYLLDRLSQHGYRVRASDDWAANLDVLHWVEQWNKGKNLWRLRAWDLEEDGYYYRIVYAFKPLARCYHVLGVFHKSDFDYEPDNPLTKRILAAYDDL